MNIVTWGKYTIIAEDNEKKSGPLTIVSNDGEFAVGTVLTSKVFTKGSKVLFYKMRAKQLGLQYPENYFVLENDNIIGIIDTMIGE